MDHPTNRHQNATPDSSAAAGHCIGLSLSLYPCLGLTLCQDLLELGDYSALFAIGSAFSCAPVTRLKETFAVRTCSTKARKESNGGLQLLDEKRNAVLTQLNNLTDNTGNYRCYKELMKNSIEQQGHAVPHLGKDNDRTKLALLISS